jgi:hypothetical protein
MEDDAEGRGVARAVHPGTDPREVIDGDDLVRLIM